MSHRPRHRNFDLIVLGAGPAGAAAAVTSAGAGLSVALVDPRHFPRDKLCGGGLTGRSMRLYREIFGQAVPPVPLERRDAIAFHAFGEDLGTDRDAPPVHLGMRCSFDHALVEHALCAGAVDFTGRTCTLDVDTGTVTIEAGQLRAPLIIAADGVNSPTARHLFGTPFDRRTIGFALEVELPDRAPERALRIDFGAAEWGYGWQFPKPAGLTIGVGGVLSRNADMKGALRRYLDTLGIHESLPVKGQFLPFGAFRAVPGRGRVLLAGDAAGLVDPLTGEGIAHAMLSGAEAARACTDALAANDPDSALPLYRKRIAPIHTALRHAARLRPILFSESLRPAFIRSFRDSRSLRREYLAMLDGQTDYGPIMRRMALRLPGFVMRAIRGV
ncbi:geranylgeranyl reductase family protein [Citreimonas salinaria]|uniref:Geranylgeranyl reductase family n=1 Tax=Citreimonas salinaria TaxID=321339 RepID=A0A1H3F7F5_9RHOB|nr:geranylgeranyl reductase family protein [Citreimonas salinaria]SDX86901.1 geranylgeranyl reductase family [Citreimonas salinaria]